MISDYLAAVIAEFVRSCLISQRESFSFETVMSSPDKIDVLKSARANGFRTYLYYIATEDPEINVSRVKNRVALKGHDVPEEKIRSRYVRSLDLLLDAIRGTDRSYLFDNSGGRDDFLWFAEITDGSVLEYKSDRVPNWFKKSILDKINNDP